MLVTNSPRFTCDDAVRTAEEHFNVHATASPLPSERDQNFLLRTDSGERLTLKIANSEEQLAVLEYQNELIRRLSDGCPDLKFPRILGLIAKAGPYFARLLTWVEGTCLANITPHSDELLASLGRALAQIDRALTGFSLPAAHRTLRWDIRHADLAVCIWTCYRTTAAGLWMRHLRSGSASTGAHCARA